MPMGVKRHLSSSHREALYRNAQIYGTGFLVGYSIRVFPASWLVATYSIGGGAYVFRLEDDGQTVGSHTGVALREKLGVRARVIGSSDGTFGISPRCCLTLSFHSGPMAIPMRRVIYSPGY